MPKILQNPSKKKLQMISIEKTAQTTHLHIITQGNTGDQLAIMKALINSLASTNNVDDKQVLARLLTDTLPNEHQLKLE